MNILLNCTTIFFSRFSLPIDHDHPGAPDHDRVACHAIDAADPIHGIVIKEIKRRKEREIKKKTHTHTNSFNRTRSKRKVGSLNFGKDEFCVPKNLLFFSF